VSGINAKAHTRFSSHGAPQQFKITENCGFLTAFLYNFEDKNALKSL